MQGKKEKRNDYLVVTLHILWSDRYEQHLTNKLHGFYPSSCNAVSWSFLVIRGLCVLDGVSFILSFFTYSGPTA